VRAGVAGAGSGHGEPVPDVPVRPAHRGPGRRARPAGAPGLSLHAGLRLGV